MKRFLIRILGACLIPLPLGVLAVFMYFAEVKTYYRDLALPPDVTITASDDSIISLGVDPAYFPHFANRSAAGMGMAAGEVRLKDLAKRHPGQLKTVLLGLSTTKFCMPRDGRIGNSERGKAFLWILHPELRKTCPMREGENVYSLFFQAEIPKRLRKFTQSLFSRKKKFLSDAAGRFEPIDTCEFMENPAKVRDQLQEFLRLQCEVSGAQKSCVLRQSASFVRTAQSNGLEVVLVKMPVHKVLREGYRPEVLSSYHAACDQLRKRACDYRQTAENEAGGVERPFRAYGKDFLQPREERLSGAGRGVGVDRVGEDPLSLFVRVASRTDGILVPMRKDSRADEKKFSWARERIICRRENAR